MKVAWKKLKGHLGRCRRQGFALTKIPTCRIATISISQPSRWQLRLSR